MSRATRYHQHVLHMLSTSMLLRANGPWFLMGTYATKALHAMVRCRTIQNLELGKNWEPTYRWGPTAGNRRIDENTLCSCRRNGTIFHRSPIDPAAVLNTRCGSDAVAKPRLPQLVLGGHQLGIGGFAGTIAASAQVSGARLLPKRSIDSAGLIESRRFCSRASSGQTQQGETQRITSALICQSAPICSDHLLICFICSIWSSISSHQTIAVSPHHQEAAHAQHRQAQHKKPQHRGRPRATTEKQLIHKTGKHHTGKQSTGNTHERSINGRE